jgi:hypothetical protein
MSNIKGDHGHPANRYFKACWTWDPMVTGTYDASRGTRAASFTLPASSKDIATLTIPSRLKSALA